MKLVKRPQAQAQITSSCSIAEQRSLDRWRSAWSGSRRQSAGSERTGTDLIYGLSPSWSLSLAWKMSVRISQRGDRHDLVWGCRLRV